MFKLSLVVKGYAVPCVEVAGNLIDLFRADDFYRQFRYLLRKFLNGVAAKQVQGDNAIVDAMSAIIMKRHNPGLTDPQLRQLITAHNRFCRYVIQQDINKIALDLREAHKDDFFSVQEG